MNNVNCLEDLMAILWLSEEIKLYGWSWLV